VNVLASGPARCPDFFLIKLHKQFNEKRLRNHCFRGKTIGITYFESVFVAFVTQLAVRMRRIYIINVACRVLTIFVRIHKWDDFREKKLLNTKCVF